MSADRSRRTSVVDRLIGEYLRCGSRDLVFDRGCHVRLAELTIEQPRQHGQTFRLSANLVPTDLAHVGQDPRRDPLGVIDLSIATDRLERW